MLIEVTQAHIDAGEAGRCFACPLALAIKDKLPNYGVAVGVDCVHLLANGRTIARPALPLKAIIFVRRFDTEEPVEPFSFELEVSE